MYHETFCKNCGTWLTEKFLENEGNIPYCETCGEFRFPSFNTAVSMIIRHPKKAVQKTAFYPDCRICESGRIG